MIQYIERIIMPYIEQVRGSYKDDTPALIIMDNFKGQITETVMNLLEANNILLPPNTTDRLQPMDLSVNKPAKYFLKRCFEEWYAQEITKQLDGRDIESTELTPINLGLPALKELGAKWLVEMADYFSDNPDIIVNGFARAGIISALDGVEDPQEEEPGREVSSSVSEDSDNEDEGLEDW